MADAEHHLHTVPAKGSFLVPGEGKVKELDSRSLAVSRRPVNVFFRPALDRFALKTDADGFLDAAQARQEAAPPVRIVDFEHERADQFTSVGNQGVIGTKFIVYLILAAALDIEHFVNLMPHGVKGFEVKSSVGTDRHPAVFLGFGDGPAALLADLGVLRHVHDVVAGDFVLRHINKNPFA